jgi:hypothetical protein
MITEKQRNLKDIKITNKRKKLWQLAPHYSKLLEDDFMWDNIKNIRNVYLEHNPIRMGIQSYPNTMDYIMFGYILSLNYKILTYVLNVAFQIS